MTAAEAAAAAQLVDAALEKPHDTAVLVVGTLAGVLIGWGIRGVLAALQGCDCAGAADTDTQPGTHECWGPDGEPLCAAARHDRMAGA